MWRLPKHYLSNQNTLFPMRWKHTAILSQLDDHHLYQWKHTNQSHYFSITHPCSCRARLDDVGSIAMHSPARFQSLENRELSFPNSYKGLGVVNHLSSNYSCIPKLQENICENLKLKSVKTQGLLSLV